MERISLDPVDQITITVLVDNVVDMTAYDSGPAHRSGHGSGWLDVDTVVGGRGPDPLLAEHGFSALVEVAKGDRKHTLLFDTGVSPYGMVENMRRLDIDPGGVEVIVLSHGHYDHTTGMHGLIERLGRPNLPVYIHPEFWRRRRINLPGREPRELPSTSRRALEDAGFDIIESQRPSFLLGGSVLVTGEIDRTTPFETGFQGHEVDRGNGWEPDPHIHDDQAIVMDLADRGLVVLTGCGHAGLVNILRHVTRSTDQAAVHAVLGGFHLGGRGFRPMIGPTVEAVAAFTPAFLVPAHCSGFAAVRAFAEAMPEAVIPNTVGTVYRFGAGLPVAP